MNPKIKKQIEEEALRRFQDDRSHLYRDRDNFLIREGFIDGAEYGYNIKESVNENIEQSIRAKLDHLESISEFTVSTDTVRAWIDLAKDDFTASNQENNNLKQAMFKSASKVITKSLNQENNEGWISVKSSLPKHLKECVFLLNNGNVCIGKVKYFEHGDSELVDFMGKGINMYKRIYRNWEIKNFDGSKEFEVTHWMPLPKAPQ